MYSLFCPRYKQQNCVICVLSSIQYLSLFSTIIFFFFPYIWRKLADCIIIIVNIITINSSCLLFVITCSRGTSSSYPLRRFMKYNNNNKTPYSITVLVSYLSLCCFLDFTTEQALAAPIDLEYPDLNMLRHSNLM